MNRDERSLAERVAELEKLCAKQSGKLEAMQTVLSDLLAAHIALRKDVRLLKFIEDWLRSDREKFEVGGTERTPAAFFEARFEGRVEILHQVNQSPVFDHYWSQKLFFRQEQRQRDELDRTRAVVMAIINKHRI